MTAVFREVRRVLRLDGTLWLNLGDSYAGSGKGIGSDHGKAVFTDGEITKTEWNKSGLKPKDLIGIPWRVAFALQADGWYLRQDIIWHKPNSMPESVTDRCTKAHEYIFLLTKSAKYFYDNEAVKEEQSSNGNGGFTNKTTQKTVLLNVSHKPSLVNAKNDGFRNRRSVWTVATMPFSQAHFATFPPKLIEPCILAGCPEGGTVLDPFFGSGTTGLVCSRLNRQYIGIELNGEYVEMSKRRIEGDAPLLNGGDRI